MNIGEIERNASKVANLLKTMSNERRLKILCTLCRGEKNVSELENIVGLSQSALSQHLAILRRDKLVKTRRHAQTVYYSLENQQAKQILETLAEIYHPQNQLPAELINEIKSDVKRKMQEKA